MSSTEDLLGYIIPLCICLGILLFSIYSLSCKTLKKQHARELSIKHEALLKCVINIRSSDYADEGSEKVLYDIEKLNENNIKLRKELKESLMKIVILGLGTAALFLSFQWHQVFSIGQRFLD